MAKLLCPSIALDTPGAINIVEGMEADEEHESDKRAMRV